MAEAYSDSEDSNYETCSGEDDDQYDDDDDDDDSGSDEDVNDKVEKEDEGEIHRDDHDVELDMSLNDDDDSTVNAHDCPICLMSLSESQLGSPNKCDHVFCFLCISEWSKNSNTCPVDRTKFDYIEVSMSKKGPIMNKIKVEDKHVLNDEEWEQAPTYCEVCNRCHREASMLLCDGCDKGYHLYCLVPPLRRVPEGDWFCDMCLVIRNETSLQSVEGPAVPDLVQELRSSTISLPPTFAEDSPSARRGRPSSSRGRGRGRPRSDSPAVGRSRSTSSRRKVSKRGKSKTKTTKRRESKATTGKRKRKTKRTTKVKRRTKQNSQNDGYPIPFLNSAIPGPTPRERLSTNLRTSSSSDSGRVPGTSTAFSIFGDEFALHDFETEEVLPEEKPVAASSCTNTKQTSTDVLGSIFDEIEVLHDNDARVSRDGRVVPSESPDKKLPNKKPGNSPEKSNDSSDVISHDLINPKKSRDESVEQSSGQSDRRASENAHLTTEMEVSTSPQQNNIIDMNSKKNQNNQQYTSRVLLADDPPSKPSIKRPSASASDASESVTLCKYIKTEPSAQPSSRSFTVRNPYLLETRDRSSTCLPPINHKPVEAFCSQSSNYKQLSVNTIQHDSVTDKESNKAVVSRTSSNPSSSNTYKSRPSLSSRFSEFSPVSVTKVNVPSNSSESRVIEFSENSKELRVNVKRKEQNAANQPNIQPIAAHPSLPKLKSSLKSISKQQQQRPKLKELSAFYDQPTSVPVDNGHQPYKSHGYPSKSANSNYEQTNQNLAIIDMLRNKKSNLKAEIKRGNSLSTEGTPSNRGYSSIPPTLQNTQNSCANQAISFHRPKLSSLLTPSSRASSLPVAVVHPSSSRTEVKKETDKQTPRKPLHDSQTTALPSLSFPQAPNCSNTMSAIETERLQNRRKGIARLQRLTSIKDTVRLVLQPFYNHHEISKSEFKDIFIRAVQKVNESNSDVNYHRIADLVKKYVKKYKGFRLPPTLT